VPGVATVVGVSIVASVRRVNVIVVRGVNVIVVRGVNVIGGRGVCRVVTVVGRAVGGVRVVLRCHVSSRLCAQLGGAVDGG
jgi:hypothetical protein